MKDPVKFIKDSYLQLLSGAIKYNGTEIPVYDEDSDPTGNQYYIIVSTVTDADVAVKNGFISEVTILIDVVTLIDMHIPRTKEIADVITGKVLQLVLPAPGQSGVVSSADFQVIDVRKESSQHLPILDTATKRIVRRITRFSQTVVER